MSDLPEPSKKRAKLTRVAKADLPTKLIDIILIKCDAREQLLITGLSKNLRERPVRAMILSAIEMSRTWPAMTSRGGNCNCCASLSVPDTLQVLV